MDRRVTPATNNTQHSRAANNTRHAGAVRSPRPAPAQRLLIDIVERGQTSWSADVRTTGIPALHSDHGSSIHVGWHTELAGLIEDLERIVSTLREWWPDLDVRISLAGSAAAARRAALRNGVALPR